MKFALTDRDDLATGILDDASPYHLACGSKLVGASNSRYACPGCGKAGLLLVNPVDAVKLGYPGSKKVDAGPTNVEQPLPPMTMAQKSQIAQLGSCGCGDCTQQKKMIIADVINKQQFAKQKKAEASASKITAPEFVANAVELKVDDLKAKAEKIEMINSSLVEAQQKTGAETVALIKVVANHSTLPQGTKAPLPWSSPFASPVEDVKAFAKKAYHEYKPSIFEDNAPKVSYQSKYSYLLDKPNYPPPGTYYKYDQESFDSFIDKES